MKTTTIRNTLILSVLFILIAGSAKSMTIDVDKKGMITGRISDFANNKPIEFITVDLYVMKDSTLLVGTLTDLEGQFTISMLDSGSYYLEIGEQNFEKKVIHPLIIDDKNPQLNLGEIMMYRTQCKSAILYSGRGKSKKKVEPQIIFAKQNEVRIY